ncbi:hypothetical protein NDU88_005767 [Pleurodeles waltl]|uniref:Secreted protein n=1 Tax=Pleurodeles waltl TaxID=8319 RepID=A0AAV7VJY5_PLEWA|nr:hypothetical protein NDU88_005767 [Pleurodeles waltl]
MFGDSSLWGLGVYVVMLLRTAVAVQACWRVYGSVVEEASPLRCLVLRVRRSVGVSWWCREVGADRHGSRSPRGLLSWFLAAAGAPISVFRGRDSDSTPLAGPYRPGESRGFFALRPTVAESPDMVLRRRCYGGALDPVCCPAVFSPPSPLQDRRGSEHSL